MSLVGNIVLIGPMGAGKTTLGTKLAQHFAVGFIDLDEEIEKRAGVDIPFIFETEGEKGFREREKLVLHEILERPEKSVIATGGGCVLDPENRKALMCERLVVHVDVSLRVQQQRLKNDKRRPILQVNDLRQKLESLREERHEIYCQTADQRVVTDDGNIRRLIMEIEAMLE